MNKKEISKNILNIADAFLVGGRENLLVDIISDTKAVELGVKYSVFVRTGVFISESLDKLKIVCPRVYLGSNKSAISRLQTLYDLIKVIKCCKINIVIAHDCSSMYWAAFCKILFPYIKIINCIHGVNVLDRYGKLKIFIANLFVDMNIAISDSVEKHCIQFKLKKIKKIYNGIKLANFNDRRAKYGMNSVQTLRIINIGRLHLAEKGQDVLVKALSECSKKGLKFHCNFVGDPFIVEPDAKIVLENMVKELDLLKDISFLGHRTDISELLSESDLFILPSKFEGFGLTILEAMACKLPVIASNQGGPADLIEHGKNGLLFKNEDYIDLAEKIIELSQNKELMQKISENGFEFVQKFDISTTCNSYYDLFEELVNRGNLNA